jgi:hypothetical protein
MFNVKQNLVIYTGQTDGLAATGKCTWRLISVFNCIVLHMYIIHTLNKESLPAQLHNILEIFLVEVLTYVLIVIILENLRSLLDKNFCFKLISLVSAIVKR